MFSRLFHFIKGPNPLQPSIWKGRLRPLTFRRFAPQDASQCLKLCRLNQPGRFPANTAKLYEEAMAGQSLYQLVVEKEGRIIATASLSNLVSKRSAVFSYGLIHPDYQGQGLGTAMTLVRLAKLDPTVPLCLVFIFAVRDSITFYRRMGFRQFSPWSDESGGTHPSGLLRFGSKEILQCRALLQDHDIEWPQDDGDLPTIEAPKTPQ